MVLITALSSSDDKVQALDLAKLTLQLLQQGSVVPGAEENDKHGHVSLKLWLKEYWFQYLRFLTSGPSLVFSQSEAMSAVDLTCRCRDALTLNVVFLLSGKQGQCVYQGLTMFDQAVWSPKPCMTCLCTGGRVVCDEITCTQVDCHFPFTPAGECCPTCMEPGRNTTCDKSHGAT